MAAGFVVKGFQVIKESQISVGDGVKDSILRQHLRFERSKKTFGERIVVAVAPGTDTLLPAVTGKTLADALAAVLAAAIGVEDGVREDGVREDDAGGLLDGVDDEISMKGGGGFPTEHAAAEKVDDD